MVVLATACATFFMASRSYGQEQRDKVAPEREEKTEEKEEGEHAAGEHAAGEHAEVPGDLSEANATDMLTAAQELRFDQALASILVFLVLFGILAKLAWKPITQGLDAREESIKKMIDEAQRNHEAAAARLREYETRLTAAAEESRAIIAQAQKDAERAAERIKVDAEQAAQRERARAVADIQAAKNAALDEVVQKSVDMAISLAGRIVQKQLSPSDHTKLINDAIEQFPSRN
jgi:F-type H+-transporting ATPase subunit b